MLEACGWRVRVLIPRHERLTFQYPIEMLWASHRAARSIMLGAAILATYAALSIVFLWPLASRLSSVVPYDLTTRGVLYGPKLERAGRRRYEHRAERANFLPSPHHTYQDLLGIWPVCNRYSGLPITLRVHNLLVIALRVLPAGYRCARLFRDTGGLPAGWRKALLSIACQ